MVEGFTLVEVNVDLARQHVGITDGEPVVIALITALVGVRPRDVSAASQIVGERRRHTNRRLPAAVRTQFIRIPCRYRNGLPRVECGQTVTGQISLVQSGVEDFFVGRDVSRINPCDVDVVLVVRQQGREDGVSGVR